MLMPASENSVANLPSSPGAFFKNSEISVLTMIVLLPGRWPDETVLSVYLGIRLSFNILFEITTRWISEVPS